MDNQYDQLIELSFIFTYKLIHMLQKPCELSNLRSCPPGIFSNINRAMYFRVHINDFRTDSLGRFPNY